MSAVADRVLAGDVRAAARLIRLIDDALPEAEAILRELWPRTGRAQLVGITGNPGAGKSTLVDRLIAHLRAQGKTVGVLAVDPTSPFTGGAILGDRIRMQDHALDPGVFIRSLATRGQLGGLSRATSDSARVLDAMGKDVILIETVGVGQDEVEICRLAHTTVVVVVPGLGDDIQAIKAGILEVADLFAVNKSDREGADRTVRDLRSMLELSHAVGKEAGHEIAIVKCVASRNEGVAEVWSAIEAHYQFLKSGPGLVERETQRAKNELVEVLRDRLLSVALEKLAQEGAHLDDLALRIARREIDPYSVADEAARL
ncbi:MAG: methylmalonyl Co-A mutase-associated GTPase MeaB [Deltaproteobacteria bacterium]|jgi:LAO/AO transport system kinase|nr:MAG: methylmalonyl Co-A mutase-associated GTPase MeaB [Deltaproteobacteria bacterium]TMB18168.1 MAG: methylmalonyl Co-A mutase-associated GTPase MeaB [Deltaproteobacteria bacterium]